MFEKLLSQLPYNPGLLDQMSFYSRRMREEASIRRIGIVFIVLAFFVQFFAVLSPPKPSVASSSNDLINGGINSVSDAVRACNQDVRDFRKILNYYGITCGEVADASTINIHAHDHNNNLFSMGHLPYGKPGETPVNGFGAGTLYWRYLWSWPYGNQPIKVLKLSATSGKTFFIMYDCGNLVSVGIPQPFTPQQGIGGGQPVSQPQPTPTPTPTPAPLPTPTPTTSPPKNCQESISSEDTTACLAIRKTAANTTQNIKDANNTTAQAGDIIVYTLYAQNTGKTPVKEYVFQENLSDVLDYASITDLHGGTMDSNNIVSWAAEDIDSGATATKQITVKVKNPVPQTPVSASDPGRFNLVMTNVYGNTINIKLPGSPGKTVETVGTTTLPNTGPGTSLMVAAAIVIVGGYFYGRSRLLAKESNLAIQENAVA